VVGNTIFAMRPDVPNPLVLAVLGGDLEGTRTLIARGDNADVRIEQGYTLLHLAAQQRTCDIARELLDHGAAVDPMDSYGNTPLWVAVFNSKGEGDLIELLLARGADPYHLNRSGRTPIDLARLIASSDVARFFSHLPPTVTPS
jgi:ankyrin repeat protein